MRWRSIRGLKPPAGGAYGTGEVPLWGMGVAA